MILLSNIVFISKPACTAKTDSEKEVDNFPYFFIFKITPSSAPTIPSTIIILPNCPYLLKSSNITHNLHAVMSLLNFLFVLEICTMGTHLLKFEI